MHYFSQVGNSASPLSSLKARLSSSFTTSPATIVATAMGSNVQSILETEKHEGDGVFAGVSSPGVNVTEVQLQKPEKAETPENFKSASLPTPPYSSACSLSQKDMEEMESTAPTTENTAVSIYSALKDYMSSTTPNNVNESHSSRRPTCHPISSVSDDPVLASHFSIPSLPDASDLPPPSNAPSLEDEKSHHTSKSSENLVKLTENAANASRFKNTPPLTPRAMSNDNSASYDRHSNGSTSAPSTSSNQRQSPPVAPSGEPDGKSRDAVTPSPQTSSDGPTVASLKGTLSVKIDQGRGLRPSIDPYVVCVFEWNEYISKGTQSGGQTPEARNGDSEFLDSDNGRPVAIPMKSRQSSHNSQLDSGDLKGKAPITDPQWNHEAVLYVFILSCLSFCWSTF